MCLKLATHIPLICKIWVESAIVLLTSSLSFQPNQDAMDNFNAVDLLWVRCTTDPLEVLRHGITFLQDPSKIDDSDCEVWCNLHITPALKGIIVKVHGAWSHQLDFCIRESSLALHPQFSQGAGCPKPENVFSH